MNREKLEKLIKNFNLENLSDFLYDADLEENREDFSDYTNEKIFQDVQKIGDIETTDKKKVLVVAVKIKGDLSERSSRKKQYDLGKKILKRNSRYNAGIFIFYDKNGFFRFSLIYLTYSGTKAIPNSSRRYTYFVSPDPQITNKTFLSQIGDGDFSTLENIKKAFSVEKVTEDFYKDIANWYFWAVRESEFPKDVKAEENGKNIAIIRLITRLIFIWFMRKRGLISNDLFEKKKINSYLKDLSPKESTYYKAILQNLFFATLSTKKEERKFGSEKRFNRGWNEDYDNQYVFRYHELFKNSKDLKRYFDNIPFLNGGLFECLDDKRNGIIIDGFSRTKKNQPIIPNFLFFSNEQDVNLSLEYGNKKKKYKVRGLIDILSSYSFTIDENDPNDAEVALDPELLGKVFENLLASFNPETSSTARKATGSYYTPREIVDYMVTQSLKEYFKTHLKGVKELNKKIDQLFKKEENENPFKKDTSKKIVFLINNLRIVDPAVGSGAFPMGILNKLVFILGKLDPENILWKQTQLNAAKNIPDPKSQKDAIKSIERNFKDKNIDYFRKLYLIQKCIYGVDIQQIAVEIAKLRFFISLLVDEKLDKTKDNWGIEPLPNLDFKIMQGNSLISEFMGINFNDGDMKENKGSFNFKDDTNDLITEFQQKKNEFQNEPDKDKKENLKNEIDDLMIQIFETKLKKQKQGYFNKLKKIEEECSILPNREQREEIITKEKQKLSKKEGFDLEKFEVQLREFSGKNKVKPFFAWKLYFAEVFQGKNPGFDIVIGNPPYVRHEEIKDQKPLLQKMDYEVYNSTSDLYTYFYELSYRILNKKGVSIFISSNKWIRAKYGEKLREFFKNKTKIIELVDFGGHKVFETATVDTCIMQFMKEKPFNDYKINFVNISNDFEKENMLKYFQKNNQTILQRDLNLNGWTLADKKVLDLKKKIEKTGTPLKDWNVKIYFGIKTSFNEAFIINTKTKEKLCKEDPKLSKIIKPILRGRDIKKYGYKWAEKWIINTNFNLDIPKLYPIIFKRLKQFESKLKKRDDQGKNWWNLRACTYYHEFEKEKIVYQEMTNKSSFSWDIDKMYVNQSGYIITNANKYILCLLNSKLINQYFKLISQTLGIGAFRWIKQYIERIPIPKIFLKQQKPFIEIVDKILEKKKYNPDADTGDLERQIDEMVYDLYGLTEEEIKIIEESNKK